MQNASNMNTTCWETRERKMPLLHTSKVFEGSQVKPCSLSSLPRFSCDQAWKLNTKYCQTPKHPQTMSKPWASHKTNICSITRNWNLVWLIMHNNYNVIHNIMIYLISYWYIISCPSIIPFTSGCHFWALPFRSIQSRPCTAKRGTPGSGICQENHFKDLQRLSRAWDAFSEVSDPTPIRHHQALPDRLYLFSMWVAPNGATANVIHRLNSLELRC